ncbi:cell division protein FtsZ [Aurantimonas sp. VKM B-3413]|uniref:cell division protein FtsZ n=1 Tax=Aurantimonas sp. VKM B-3413 TaxID=2779401 RepID=UPI001E461CBE|nr:cell division protein FtsZ [Aurantimonas sp. VKM B-3413]MCB8837879.1 cell division protein FtsZ [Aurantimonas sp. VKM B-3413]
MSITLKKPDITELKPRITVFGVGGGGCNAVNNMINAGLEGVEFVIANTDAQALRSSRAERIIQMGVAVTEGLGAGSQPEVGRAAAEESIDEICDHLLGSHMCFVTAGMGGGTGTGAAPVVARAAREKGILTVGVVTKPFHFEGQRRLRIAEQGIEELQKNVDTLIVIPNQNLFRIANDKTTFADAFGMADQVLYSGVACITDLMVKEGLINLDFADVRSVMREMGKAMMGTGEASGEGRAMAAAEAAIANPLLDETSMKGARGLLISITGGRDLTLFEVDEAATRIREEVDQDANIILGATFDENLEGVIRVSVVATGIDKVEAEMPMRPAAAAPQPAAAPRQAPIAAAPQPAPAPVQPQAPSFAEVQESVAAELEDDFSAALEAEISQVTQAPAAPVRRPAPQEAAATPRMPRVEDFPPMVRAEIETRAASAEQGDERGPMGLLRRLTTGLSRREEEEHQQAETRRPTEASPYAPRRSAADSAARPATAARPASEDDQLEIPAFLRRQAN